MLYGTVLGELRLEYFLGSHRWLEVARPGGLNDGSLCVAGGLVLCLNMLYRWSMKLIS